MRIPNPRHLLALLVCIALLSSPALAESEWDAAVADTSSPRATLRSFIDACNAIDSIVKSQAFVDRSNPRFQPIAQQVIDCIDTSKLPAFAAEQRALEVAVSIKEILDRQELPTWDEIPDLEAIDTPGGLDEFSRWRIPGTRLTIARIEEGPQKHEFLFSAGTVDRAVKYFHSVQARPYRKGLPQTSPGLYKWYLSAPGHPGIAKIVEQLPDGLRFGRTLGLANWKWPGILVALLMSGVLMVVIYRLHLSIAGRSRTRNIFLYWLTLLLPLSAVVIPILFAIFAERFLTVRGNALYVIGFAATVVVTMASIVVVFAVTNRVAETIISSPRVNRRGINAQLIRIASKLISVVLASAAFMVGGQYLGIPIATLLASAGIGGIALALGAQDTLKTLFGTIMLMADKPFRVGERIIFKGYDGVVEDIGLRSTRIRLLTSHQVTVPNDQLAGSDIENVGRRERIRRLIDFQIPNNTPSDSLESAVDLIRELLDEHEGMHEDFPPRVFFVDFMPDSFTIRVMYWYHPPNYWDFLAFSEKLNFAIFRAFEERGIKFSLPQRVTHTSLDSEQAPIDVRMIESKTSPNV